MGIVVFVLLCLAFCMAADKWGFGMVVLTLAASVGLWLFANHWMTWVLCALWLFIASIRSLPN